MNGLHASSRTKARGQPLFVLMALLLGWAGLRAAFWEDLNWPVVSALGPQPAAALAKSPPVATLPAAAPSATPLALRLAPQAAPSAFEPASPPQSLPAMPEPVSRPGEVPLPSPLPMFAPVRAGNRETPRIAAGHQLAWMAAIAQLPLPSLVFQGAAASRLPQLFPGAAGTNRVAAPAASRWSMDGWLLLRQGGVPLTSAGLPAATYGASQAGAVIRYRLAPASPRQPALYLRTTSAVARPRGEEAALGLSSRLIPSLPVALHAELRVAAQAGGAGLRPALGAVTELPRLALPGGLSAEVYGQAGYVGGPNASLYADGQVRLDRVLGRIEGRELRAGLGAWGGAQQGARRLDIGPTATIAFPIGAGHGRVSADWRLRASGNAVPQSGPAITLSAGF